MYIKKNIDLLKLINIKNYLRLFNMMINDGLLKINWRLFYILTILINCTFSFLIVKDIWNVLYILFVQSLQAIEGTYIDKKCPFTGNVSIRGRILTGVVQKMKMQRTIVIRRDYLHYIRKYNRFEKRHRNMSVHLSPCFRY